MASYSVAEAKNRLPALINAAKRGEAVTITRYGKPEVRITPIVPTPKVDIIEALERLRVARSKIAVGKVSGAEIVRAMRDEERF